VLQSQLRAFNVRRTRPIKYDGIYDTVELERDEIRACTHKCAMSASTGIVLQNSFWITEDKFSGLWARRSNNRAGDHSN